MWLICPLRDKVTETQAGSISPSRSNTRRTSSKAADMFPLGNRIWPKPLMLLNCSQPSSIITTALVKPRRPWNNPASWITFIRAWSAPSAISSSAVITRKAMAAASSISANLAMLVTPAATAYLLARRLPAMMMTGAAVGAVSAITGLYLSFYVNIASGAAIVLVCTGFFILAFLFAPSKGALWSYLRNRNA